MKKLQWLTNRLFATSILLITTLFIIPPTFAIADGSKVSFYEYIYGAPFRWLTVISTTDKKGAFTEMFFSGNEGYNYPMAQSNDKLSLNFPCNNYYLFPSKKALR